MYGRKDKITIGLVVEDVFTDFAKDIIRNLLKAINLRKDLSLVIVAGKFIDADEPNDNNHKYKILYNSIYTLEEKCRFDGLIIALGSMAKIQRDTVKERYLSKLKDIPKVFLVSDIENCVAVNYDNEPGIREAVNCLVNAHAFTEFGMLGGREDNMDSRDRHELFVKCLEENGIKLSERAYVETDMSENSVAEAGQLLDNNPRLQAVFCVNDAVAQGLYKAMAERRKVPGRDIMVFGFDNTRSACEMNPPLSSIGAFSDSLGQKALQLLMEMMNGNTVSSVTIPTRLYGRASLPYEMYQYNVRELLEVDTAFVYRMFDDCFYRYQNEIVSRQDIDLKRLFYEFISRMLFAMKNRQMGREDFNEIARLIDIFFDNGAMEYTDSLKFIDSVTRLQNTMNATQKNVHANIANNRLFVRIRDRALQSISSQRIKERSEYLEEKTKLQQFIIESTLYQTSDRDPVDQIILNFDKLGFKNAALYLCETPKVCDLNSKITFPESLKLMCVMRDGELSITPKERQSCPLSNIFSRDELTSSCKGYIAFPIIFRDIIFGILVCESTLDLVVEGEFVADQVGRALCFNKI